jgi:hypothetical protein
MTTGSPCGAAKLGLESPREHLRPHQERLALSAPLCLGLGDRELGRRDRLEALVGDRLSAQHGASVGAVRETMLRALDRGELLPKIPATALVELVLQQLSALIAAVELVRFRSRGLVHVDEFGELALDTPAFGGQELARSVRIHVRSLTTLGASNGTEPFGLRTAHWDAGLPLGR